MSPVSRSRRRSMPWSFATVCIAVLPGLAGAQVAGPVADAPTQSRSPNRLVLSVGHENADVVGADHVALQSAVDRVAALGGGTVRVQPGRYQMGNSLFLRSGVRIIGAGDATVLRKSDAHTTTLVEDADWYDQSIRVADPSIFRPWVGIWIEGTSPFFKDKPQLSKRTVIAVEGDRVHLDRELREDYWTPPGARATTVFPVISGDSVNDVVVESLSIDGNRGHNPHVDDNHAGGIFLQDSDRITIRNVTIRDYNSDGISAQVCDDLVVEGCRISNCADLGIHPGSGCQRPRMTDNVIRNCTEGIFFCWGVRHGLAEGNTIEDSGKFGVSIGHRDTDNVVRNNTIRRSAVSGLVFRDDHGPGKSPDRCVIEGNLIEDSGREGECVAVVMNGTLDAVVIRGNRIVDGRPAASGGDRIGIRISSGITGLVLEGNTFSGMNTDVADLRRR